MAEHLLVASWLLSRWRIRCHRSGNATLFTQNSV